MEAKIRERIFSLLDSIKADFPRRKKATEELMRTHGISETLDIEIAVPDKVVDVLTFDPKVSRKLTPMLKARFEYAGTWKMGQEIWLSASQIASTIRNKTLHLYHLSLREHWEGSAPMSFSDDRLTLFKITEFVPENLTYLVWSSEVGEPGVWVYEGFDTYEFENLEQYLKWCLERE